MIASAALMLCACLTAGPFGFPEYPDSADPCSAVFGNGKLTVAVDAKGNTLAIQWPAPTGPNQMGPSSDSVPRGIDWGVRTDGVTTWLRDDAWQVDAPSRRDAHGIVTARLAHGDLRATWTQFVSPSSDVLVVQLALEAAPKDAQVCWHANLDPATRSLPEWPWLADIAPARRDFALFAAQQGDALVHFRPDAPASYDWIDAERIRDDGGSFEKWDAFGEGAWLAYAPSNPVPFACGVASDENAPWQQAAQGALRDTPCAVGDGAASAILLPDTPGSAQWTVFIAFAKNGNDVLETVRAARTKGFQALRDETRSYWDARTAAWALDRFPDGPLRDVCARGLSTLSIATGQETAAIARAPVDRPPLAMDIVRHGVWATIALDLAGEHELADRHTQFYAGAVRQKARPAAPTGSIPMALLSDGTEALPHVCLDVEAIGWLLWSIHEHQSLLADTPRRVYLDRMWESTDLAASFLTQWFRDPFTTPPYSFNPQALRDTPSADLAISAYAGLSSAIEIAEFLNIPRPDWKARLGEEEDLVRSYATGDDGTWLPNAPLSLGLTGLVSGNDPAWAARMDDALHRIDTMTTPEAVKTLCFAALAWRASPESLARLQPLVEPVFQRVCNEFPADSYYASLAFIAARLAFGSPP